MHRLLRLTYKLILGEGRGGEGRGGGGEGRGGGGGGQMFLVG